MITSSTNSNTNVLFYRKSLRDVAPEPPLPPPPKIQLIRQSVAKYCLVIDYSSSMEGDRMRKLKESTRRWITEEVDVGSWVGVVRFS